MTHSKALILFLLIIGLGAPALPLPAQAEQPTLVVSMPPTASLGEVSGLFLEGRIGRGLDRALNSEGDSVTLLLELEASLGLFLNAGLGASRTATLERTENGYELMMAMDNSLSFGAELVEDLEIQFPIGTEIQVRFRFDQLQDVERALVAAALSGIGAPAALLQVEDMGARIRQITSGLPDLQDAITEMTRVRDAARRTAESLGRASSRARAKYRKVMRKWKKAERKLKKLKPFGKALKKLSKRLRRSARGLERVWRAADRTYRAAIREADRIGDQLEAMSREVARQIDLKGRLERAVDALFDFLEFTAREVRWLGERFGGIAGRFHVGAEASVEAPSLVPGLSLANTGVGFSFGTEMDMCLSYSTPFRGEPGSLTLSGSFSMGGGGLAAFGAGFEANASTGACIETTWNQSASGWDYAGTDVEFELDIEAWLIIGGGISLEEGGGATLALLIDADHTTERIMNALHALVRGDTARTASELGALEATLSLTARRHHALVAGGGFSTAGNGASMTLSGIWLDEALNLSATVNAAWAIEQITSGAESLAHAVGAAL